VNVDVRPLLEVSDNNSLSSSWNVSEKNFVEKIKTHILCSITFLLKNHAVYDIKLNSVALVRTRTIPTERPPPVGEVSANFCG